MSETVRNEAVLLCAIGASNDIGICEAGALRSSPVDSIDLALEAQAEACRRIGMSDYDATYDEAEALLRTGWSPS